MGQFDRSAFKASGERVFDEVYQFDRGLTDTFRYANTQKNGSLEQRMALYREKREIEQAQKLRPAMKAGKSKKGKQQQTSSKINLFKPKIKSLLDRPVYDDPLLPRKKKKKKKGHEQDQSQGYHL